ncbi:MAG: hypothetical protein HY279_09230 [Nitrospinae bacterium]|nr:hypothetical protein [Nitrospinota bacterium]
MKKLFIPLFFSIALLSYSAAFAVEVAPRISDKEIIEKLAKLEEGQNTIRAEIKINTEAIKQLREDMKQDIKQLREDNGVAINQLREDIRWMFGTLVTIAVVVLGFMLRMQWQMHRRQTQMETTLETQKDELSFLKSLIEKLLPPRGVL